MNNMKLKKNQSYDQNRERKENKTQRKNKLALTHEANEEIRE